MRRMATRKWWFPSDAPYYSPEREGERIHPPWSRKGLKPRLQADCDGSKNGPIRCGTRPQTSVYPPTPCESWKHAEETSFRGRRDDDEAEAAHSGKGAAASTHAGWGTVVAIACGPSRRPQGHQPEPVISERMQISMQSRRKMPALGQRKEFSKPEEPGGRWCCYKLCYFSPCSL